MLLQEDCRSLPLTICEGCAMESVIAVLDANVLFPASLRDTLLRAGQRDYYRMHWTAEILEEVRRNLVKTGRSTAAQVQRLVDTLLTVFPRSLITGDYLALIPAMQNADSDRHVLATAVVCKAQVIVTNNLRDFPPQALAPYIIEAQMPDTFLMNLCQDNLPEIAQIIIEQAADLRNPPRTVEQELKQLAKHAPTFVETMRDYLLQR